MGKFILNTPKLLPLKLFLYNSHFNYLLLFYNNVKAIVYFSIMVHRQIMDKRFGKNKHF